jgi:molecular chaperone IbpA
MGVRTITRLLKEKTMSKLLPSPFGNLKHFDQLFVGFDGLIDRVSKQHTDLTRNFPNYPPYNIKKTDDNKYVIEIAVAGFSKSEIEIELNEDTLVIRGNAKDDSEDYLFKGIGMRNFTRTFALSDNVEVKGAGLVNGMLKVALERIIPESKKPKRIEIQEDGVLSKRQLLNETL